MRIFIVDDEEDIAEMYSEAIKLCGHTVIGIACNGEEAVEKYAGFVEPPDVIIMDHRMPVKTGLEATKEILALNPRLNIIFASADASVEREAIELRVAAFKKKPFTLDRLLKNIEKLENSQTTE